MSAVAGQPGRLCKLCRRLRPFAEFVWEDKQGGRSGVTGRCVACRNRGKRPDPNMPKLRYPLTRHAVERYAERVRPDLVMELGWGRALQRVRLEMCKRMAYAPWSREWPEWLADRDLHGDEDVGHLLIDDDTVFVLSAEPNGARVVVTVLTRLSGEGIASEPRTGREQSRATKGSETSADAPSPDETGYAAFRDQRADGS